MTPARFDRPSLDELFAEATETIKSALDKPNILSYAPYGDQLPFHQSTCFGRILSAGNRAGKTDAMVVEFIHVAMNMDPFKKRPEKWGDGPVQLRIIVVDISKGVEQIMLPKFKRWMTKSMYRGGSFDKAWDSKNLILHFSNGSTIDFLTYQMTLEKMGGVPRHMIGFDEEPPQNIFNEAMMRLIDYDGVWIIAATPQHGMDWIYDLLVEPSQNGDLEWVEVFNLDSSQNPYLLAEDRDKFYIGMAKEERAIREKGEFVARAGLVFPQFAKNLDKYVIERHDWIGRKDVAFYTSVDSGWNNPTAWLWIAVYPDGRAHVFAEHYSGQMTVAEHSTIVKAREKEWKLEVDAIQRTGDPAMKQHSVNDGNSTLMLYAQHGIYIGVETVPHDVMIGIMKLQQYLAFREDGLPSLTISPNCPNLIRELKKLRWATYDSDKQNYSKNKQETVHKKDDHAFDSLRYWSTQMPDLRPLVQLPTKPEVPTTLDYGAFMAKLRDDPDVEFVEDARDWEIVEGFDLYDPATEYEEYAP